MHPLIKELHTYHLNVCNNIEQMKALLKRSKSEPSSATERQALFSLLGALHSDAETRHHHNEELIRQLLLTTRAPIHPRVLDIERDHRGFDRIAKQLRALEDSSLTPAEIATFIEDYIHKYYDHLDSEENIFFPLAEKLLTASQWLEIEQQWQKEPD
jgi:hemerythrin-like domain-containing protein